MCCATGAPKELSMSCRVPRPPLAVPSALQPGAREDREKLPEIFREQAQTEEPLPLSTGLHTIKRSLKPNQVLAWKAQTAFSEHCLHKLSACCLRALLDAHAARAVCKKAVTSCFYMAFPHNTLNMEPRGGEGQQEAPSPTTAPGSSPRQTLWRFEQTRPQAKRGKLQECLH